MHLKSSEVEEFSQVNWYRMLFAAQKICRLNTEDFRWCLSKAGTLVVQLYLLVKIGQFLIWVLTKQAW